MKAHLRLFILLSFVLPGCLSCSREAPFTPVECQYFVEETFSRTVTFDDVFRSIKEEYEAVGVDADAFISKFETEIRMVRMLSQTYTAHGITYRTVDVEGNPVIASGVVYLPKSGTPGTVVELSPHNEWKGGCVTKNPMPSELAMSMRGQVCLIPDLIGFGSTEEYPIAFLQHDNIARVSADLRAAAGLKIPFDWVPSCPVRLFHAGADETIPRTGTDNLAAYLKAAGADVTYTVAEDVTHREMYFVMCKDFITNVR